MRILRIVLFVCGCFASLALAQTPAPSPIPKTSGLPVTGFADLHLHHTMQLSAFGGGWYWGSHDGPESVALQPCDGGKQHARQQLSKIPFGRCIDSGLIPKLTKFADKNFPNLVGKSTGAGDVGLHPSRKNGYPAFDGWPRWDSIGHQQAWSGWLREAHQHGLNLVVTQATDFGPLCNLIPPENRQFACDEMTNVDIQLNAEIEFAQNNSSWVEIALTPADARRIIRANKLALVLGIETSDLFGRSPDINAELTRYYQMGVRSIQPGHLINSRFTDVASISAAFQIIQFLEPYAGPQCHTEPDCPLFDFGVGGVPGLGFPLTPANGCKGAVGLTSEGVQLINGLMQRGMLIDVSHLTEKAINDIYRLAVANTYYPIFSSHGYFRSIVLPDDQIERTLSTDLVDKIMSTGGIFGVLPGPSENQTYARSRVENSCHGSVRSFAQMYDLGRIGYQANMAFGSDLNCFTAHTRPRFGETGACSASKLPWEQICFRKRENSRDIARAGTDIDTKGLAHVGLLDDMANQLDALGSDATNLRHSAENFIQMWERAVVPARAGPVPVPPRDPANLEEAISYYTLDTRKSLSLRASDDCAQHYQPRCSGADNSCVRECREEKRECKTTCREDKRECAETCRDTRDDCVSQCSNFRCRQQCRREKRACKRECRVVKGDCFTNCRGGKQTCKMTCDAANWTAFVNCDDEYSGCVCDAYESGVGLR